MSEGKGKRKGVGEYVRGCTTKSEGREKDGEEGRGEERARRGDA